MLPVYKLIEVHELLQAGQISQREIARRLRVSRSTVSAVSKGQRPLESLLQRAAETFADQEGGPVGRCPTCGGKVTMPCRACWVRAARQPVALHDPPITRWRGGASTGASAATCANSAA